MSLLEAGEGLRGFGSEDVVGEVGEGGEGFDFEVGFGGGEEEGFGDGRSGRVPGRRLWRQGKVSLRRAERGGII